MYMVKDDRSYQINMIYHQKLSKSVISGLVKEQDCWLYKTTEFKKRKVVKTALYECYADHFIAYVAVRSDHYSVFNFQ